MKDLILEWKLITIIILSLTVVIQYGALQTEYFRVETCRKMFLKEQKKVCYLLKRDGIDYE